MTPAAAHELVPLHALPAGQTALVMEVHGQPEQVHRLHEMGFRRGMGVEMVRPGTPCIIRMRNHTLCFRPSEVVNILVRRGIPA